MKKPSFLFLVSPDSFLLKNAVQEVSAKHSPGAGAETHVFWGDDGLSDVFWNHLILQGLFAQAKILVIRNAQNIPAAVFKELSQALERAPSAVVTLLCLEVPFERNAPKIPAHISKLACFTHAKKSSWIVTLPSLTTATMSRFIEQEAKKLQLALSPPLVTKLVSLLPPDAATIITELQKLSLLATEQGHLPESALRIISQSNQHDIFWLLSAVQQGSNNAAIWEQLSLYSQSGESAIFGFLATLTREARSLWQLFFDESPALPPQIIPRKKALAKSLGLGKIAKLWDFALTAEQGIKSGEQDPKQAFEFLMANLACLFQQRTF